MTKDLVLGQYRYTLTHAPSRKTLQVCAKLGNAGASLFAGMAEGRGGARVTNAIAYLLQAPDLGATLDYIVNAFAPHTQVSSVVAEGAAQSFSLADCIDQHFAGRMSDFAKWIEAVVDFECGDFLGELVEKFVASLAAMVRSDSPSPQPAPMSGSSGA